MADDDTGLGLTDPSPPAEAEAEAQPEDRDDTDELWVSDALSAQVVFGDDPNESLLEIMLEDLEGRIGVAIVPLDPVVARDMRSQLDEVIEAQDLADWVAEGGEVEDFVGNNEADIDAPVGHSRRERLTDPLAVRTWMDQGFTLMGIPAQYVIVALAVLVGVIVALGSLLT